MMNANKSSSHDDDHDNDHDNDHGLNSDEFFIRKHYLAKIGISELDQVFEFERGGSGVLYEAIWKDGRVWDSEVNTWKQIGTIPVIMKPIMDLKEVEMHLYLHCCKEVKTPECFGLTRYPNDTGQWHLVLSRIEHGDLYKFRSLTTSWISIMQTCIGIAENLSKIHDADIMHCDLHPGNVLIEIDDRGGGGGGQIVVYISDFEHSRTTDPAESKTNSIVGVMPYVSPEVLRGKPRTKAADIYGLAVIMWFLASGRRPFSGRNHDIHLLYEICDNIREKIPLNVPKPFGQLIIECWDPVPDKRPNIGEVLDRLIKMNSDKAEIANEPKAGVEIRTCHGECKANEPKAGIEVRTCHGESNANEPKAGIEMKTCYCGECNANEPKAGIEMKRCYCGECNANEQKAAIEMKTYYSDDKCTANELKADIETISCCYDEYHTKEYYHSIMIEEDGHQQQWVADVRG